MSVSVYVAAKELTKPLKDAHASHGDHAGASGPSHDQKADMMHNMGHAPGMSMQDMANDMRCHQRM